MVITRFEDIHAWQAARELCKIVYQLTKSAAFARDLELLRQVRDATTSVMANIAEGFDSHSNSEFIRFLYYALRSASEVQSHFYVALDQSYVDESQFSVVYEQASRTKGLIFRFIDYLRTHDEP